MSSAVHLLKDPFEKLKTKEEIAYDRERYKEDPFEWLTLDFTRKENKKATDIIYTKSVRTVVVWSRHGKIQDYTVF